MILLQILNSIALDLGNDKYIYEFEEAVYQVI